MTGPIPDRAAALLLLAALAGCSTLDPRGAGLARAHENGLTVSEVAAGRFEIVTFHRGLGRGGELDVYIEGDGRAWITRSRLSPDPTPRDPLALDLALKDPGPAVLYVSRPCQYLTREALARCDPRHWAGSRYAEEVVTATGAVLDWARRHWTGPVRIGLVGYSGGGALATLLAARRPDVAWLISVAANLDHEAWTRLHDVTPLHDSLNPATVPSDRLDRLPQLHLAGGRDVNVPVSVIESYFRTRGISTGGRLEIVAEADHRCCWVSMWPAPLCRIRERPAAGCPDPG